jgi:acyl-CoA reductase-like NAD-dependent aldehyde dehydrogenase
MEKIASINPSNKQILAEINSSSYQEIQVKVEMAQFAKIKWHEKGITNRIKILRDVFSEFQQRKQEIILLESIEMGSPLKETESNFDSTMRCANENFAVAEKYLSSEISFENSDEIHKVYHEPIGVSAVIIPWNFPFANFVWNGLQSLLAGNTIVLKHSEECPLIGQLIEEVLLRHLPEGVFSEVYGDGAIGSFLVDQNINMLSFTGSTTTGKLLYEKAGKKFIKSVMELGGSAPGIIFEDANCDLFIDEVCDLRLFNAGQCCDGLKRLIVHEKHFATIAEKISTIFSSKKIGNAQDKQTDIGPLVSKKQLDLLIFQIEEAKKRGANVLTGGNSLEKQLGGYFFEPTVLTNIKTDMRVWQEEVFGPVLPMMSFRTEQEAIDIANQTQYGLSAYIFTKNKDRADKIAKLIDAGMISINGKSYIRYTNPFGGYKYSGIGRLHGKYGFYDLTQRKVIATAK